MNKTVLKGIMPAAIAVFKDDGSLDVEGYKRNLEFYLEQGCTGIVCNGSTGEAINLSREERLELIRAALEVAKGRATIIAGTGAPTTKEALILTQDAAKAGVDAVLVITPFNCIPNKDGLLKHYLAVCEVGVPVILYNLPQHTQVAINLDILEKLAEREEVVGIKDSSGDLGYFAELIKRFGDRLVPITGCDDLLLQAFCLGANAAILALGNIAPRMLINLLQAVEAGNLAEARRIYYSLLPISKIISNSVNFPAPVKEAVKLLGRPSGNPRMPILPVSIEESKAIRTALTYAGLFR